MILQKVKTVGLCILLAFTFMTTMVSVFLYNKNVELNVKLSDKELELKDCQSKNESLEKEKKVADDSLVVFFDEQEKLADDFLELKRKFNEKKCRPRVEHIYLRKEVTNEPPVESVNNDSDNIHSIRLLLDEAACRANNNCRRPESPSARL